MLIYVIPFILLLVIAVVLKKRETNKQAEQTSTAKAKAKKVSATKKTPQKTQIVSDPVVEKKKTTPLSDDVRNKIGALISERNFFSAEAQINQSLNKDNSQHELYLLLLDIHILQKDEFAISQLINHLRSLELDEFLDQALAKKAAHDQAAAGSRDTIDFKTESSAPTLVGQKNTADFDALMNHNSAASSVTANSASFDALQQETASTPKDVVEEIKPLDFSSLSLDSAAKITPTPEPTPVIDEIQPLDFSFSLDTPVTKQSAQPTEVAISLEAAVEEKPEFDFNFSHTETVAPIETKIVTETTNPSLDLEFNLGPSISNEPLVVETAPAKVSGLSSSASQADRNDPLIQSFPELVDVNEISLNLELAEQYIQLGAFQAASELLTEHEANYSTEQSQQANQLRNQIAS